MKRIKRVRLLALALVAGLTVSMGLPSRNSRAEAASPEASNKIQEILELASREIFDTESFEIELEIKNRSSNFEVPTKEEIEGSIFMKAGSSQIEKGVFERELKSAEGKQKSEVVMSGETGNPLYIRENGGAWTRQEEEGQVYYFHPNYKEIFKSILEIADELEMTEERHSYKFRSKPGSKKIASVLGPEFHLQLTGVSEDELEQTLKFKIDKKTMQMEELEMSLYYEVGEERIDIEMEFETSDFNEVDPKMIVIPTV
ncbi:MAG: hypothetical protein Q4P72_03750 [Eubacteriales bacterium]|nr:hypothetical protein [Eubacteriales bacterium]